MRAEALTKSYRRGSEIVHALEDVDMEVVAGRITALVGPSGSGKTTLLYLLAGWERPDRGRILWEEVEVAPAELPWGSLALVPQSLGLIEELTVRENVFLPLRLSGSGEPDRVESLIAQLGLAELADRYPLETSLGEQQRTTVARALALEPRVVLADEPTGHQDEASAEAVFSIFGAAAAAGAACLIATHDPDVARFADLVMTMKDGHVGPVDPSAAPARRDDSMWAPSRSERSS